MKYKKHISKATAALTLLALAACGGGESLEPLEPLPPTLAPHASIISAYQNSGVLVADDMPSGASWMAFHGSPYPLEDGSTTWDATQGEAVNGITIRSATGVVLRIKYAADGLFSELSIGDVRVYRMETDLAQRRMNLGVEVRGRSQREYRGLSMDGEMADLPGLLYRDHESPSGNSRTQEYFTGAFKDMPRTDTCSESLDFKITADASNRCVAANVRNTLWNTAARLSTSLTVLREFAEYVNEPELADALRKFLPLQFQVESRLLELSHQVLEALVPGSDPIGENYRRGTRIYLADIHAQVEDTSAIHQIAQDLRKLEADPNATDLHKISTDDIVRPDKRSYRPEVNGQAGDTEGSQVCLSQKDGGCAIVPKSPPTGKGPVMTCPSGYTTEMWAHVRDEPAAIPLSSLQAAPVGTERIECWSGSNRATNRRTVVYFHPGNFYVSRIERWKGFALDGEQESLLFNEDGFVTPWRSVMVSKGQVNGPFIQRDTSTFELTVDAIFVKDQPAGLYQLFWGDGSQRSVTPYSEIGAIALSSARYARKTGQRCYGGFAQVTREDPTYGACAQ